MPDVTLTISLPILVGAEKFKTRYRPVGGVYSSNVDRTNAPFTLTGLSVGTYELEVIFVRADGTECPAVISTFIVTEPFECIEDFAAEIVQNGQLYYLQITYTAGDNPPCGWDIFISNSNGLATIPYTTLPAGGVINIPLPGNLTTSVSIRANICAGNYQFCFEDTATAIVPDCTPAILNNADLILLNPVTGEYALRVFMTNSIPLGNYIVNYSEQSVGIPAGSGISGAATYAGVGGTNVIYSTKVVPKGVNISECLKFVGSVIDACGVSHPFCVTNPEGCIGCD